jgi:CDP-diacylglycerol--glycerol-3-phosphate 3-phosphatidyltransferase
VVVGCYNSLEAILLRAGELSGFCAFAPWLDLSWPTVKSRYAHRMQILPDRLKNGYLRLIDPVANLLVRSGIHPNTITAFGTLCTIIAAAIFATGHIRTAGWFLGLTALFDVLDGTVARRSGQESTFGAFLDSTLDRLADGALFVGLATFYALDPVHHSASMMLLCMSGLVGALMTSYTRARAEALGIDAKVGMVQRAERVVLLSVPQAFFGLALDGWVLNTVVGIITIGAWITVIQRVAFVRSQTSNRIDAQPLRLPVELSPTPKSLRRKLKGE